MKLLSLAIFLISIGYIQSAIALTPDQIDKCAKLFHTTTSNIEEGTCAGATSQSKCTNDTSCTMPGASDVPGCVPIDAAQGTTSCITLDTIDSIYSGCQDGTIKNRAAECGTVAQTSNSNSLGSGPPATYEQCTELQTLVDKCTSDSDDAVNSACNPSSNQGMTSTLQMLNNVTDTMTAMSGTSLAAACSKMTDISGTANTALLGFKGVCQVAQTACTNSCDEATNALKTANTSLNCPQLADMLRTAKVSCNKAANSLQTASKNVAAIMSTKMIAQQCAAMTGNSFCAQNPTLPMCLAAQGPANCSDPANTSTVCVCMRTPNSPLCGSSPATGLQQGSQSANSGTSGGGAPTGTNGLTGMPSTLGDGFGGGVDPSVGGDPNSGGRGGGGGAKGTGRNISGGEAPQTAGGKPQVGGGQKYDPSTKVNGGYYGGGGGSYVPSSSGGSQSGGSAASAGRNGNGQVNLKDFMPDGSRYAKRGVASGGPDGLTGQGTDLWQKVNSRYLSLSGAMKK